MKRLIICGYLKPAILISQSWELNGKVEQPFQYMNDSLKQQQLKLQVERLQYVFLFMKN